jgi:hypothetical protein
MMRYAIAVVLVAAAALPSWAAEWRSAPASPVAAERLTAKLKLPFSRSERADAVWAETACHYNCSAHCAWGLAACLGHDAQGYCLQVADACDRYCQRQCRTQGGPWVTDLFDAWE